MADGATNALAFLMTPAAAAAQPSPKTNIALFHAGGREAEVEEVFRRILASGAPLDRYERERRARVKWVQDQSRRFGVLGQLDSPIACVIRDRAVRLVPPKTAAKHLEPLLLGGPC